MQPHSKWDDLDFELFDALDLLEREMNDSTGHPRWLTGTGSPDVDFWVETAEDAAQAALDRHDERQSGKKKQYGLARFAVPESITGLELEGGLARERLLRYAQDQVEAGDGELGVLGVETRRPKEGYDLSAYD